MIRCQLFVVTMPDFVAMAWLVVLAYRVSADCPVLQGADADMDLDYDQLDWVKVLQAGKYLTGEPATWGEGDWNGGPGGEPGNPPPGDGLFDVLDVIAALGGGTYLTGPYASPCGRRFTGLVPQAIDRVGVQGDDQISIVYDVQTGEIAVDAPAGKQLTSINIDSAFGIFKGNKPVVLVGAFDNFAGDNIFKANLSPRSSLSSFGTITFGEAAPSDLAPDFLLNDLQVIGSLAGGGPLGDVDLVIKICKFFGRDLTQADFSGQDARGICFKEANLEGVDFQAANLTNASFVGARLAGSQFRGAIAEGAQFGSARLADTNFSRANLAGASFGETALNGANLSFADLRGTDAFPLSEANTRNAILPNNSIEGLVLQAAEELVVRDDARAINVNNSMSLVETSTLDLRFEDAFWGSTIHVAPDVTPNLRGTLELNLNSEANVNAMTDVTFGVFNWNGQLPREETFDRIVNQPGVKWDTDQLYTTGNVRLLGVAELLPGDGNRDLMFDQSDLVQVLQADKYLTGEPATWGEGDWNGAPGGWWGSPPAGDGVFDQFDIVNTPTSSHYLTGPYASIKGHATQVNGQAAVVYNPKTGEVAVEARDGMLLSSINIVSAAGIFTGDPALSLSGTFDNHSDDNLFKAVFGGSFGSLTFGTVAQSGLSEAFIASDLTVIGSLDGGGNLEAVELIYVPEPSTIVPLAIALGMLAICRATGRCPLIRYRPCCTFKV